VKEVMKNVLAVRRSWEEVGKSTSRETLTGILVLAVLHPIFGVHR
jgi:hypothetical protein